jgi:hypothetical protein
MPPNPALAEMRAYLESYLRHGGPLEQRAVRGDPLDAEERSLLVGRLIRLITRLHVGREKLRERRAGPDLSFAETMVEQGRAAFHRALGNREISEELDRKVDFRLEQLRFAHVYHEMTGHYHDLLAARSECEALMRELPDLPASVLARDLLITVDNALKEKHPKLEELWVGPFGRLDDFAVHYPRIHWWWYQR